MTKLLSIREASEVLGLKPSTLHKYVCERTIPFVKLGSRLLFKPESLEAWVAARAHEPEGAGKRGRKAG